MPSFTVDAMAVAQSIQPSRNRPGTGKNPEGEKVSQVRINAFIPSELRARLKRLAGSLGESEAATMERAIRLLFLHLDNSSAFQKAVLAANLEAKNSDQARKFKNETE